MPADVVGLGTQVLRIRYALLEAELRRPREQIFDAVAPLGASVQRVVEARGAVGEIAVTLEYVFEQMSMGPDTMRRVAGVLLTLQPIAIDDVDRDLAHGVGPNKQIPARQDRRGQRPQIGENEPAEFLHRIGLQLGLEPAFAAFHRPLDAGAFGIIQPAMIRTAQPAFVRNAELNINET